jgi:ubiquinone/menaquinone biosynthesis C-methylase UbiE
MKQNIYDDEAFFAGYHALRESQSGLNEAIEDPAVCELMPSILGKRVLDLGSGFGDFCRYAVAQGASQITGVEISEKMLKEAQRRTHESGVAFVRAAIEDFEIGRDRYDLIVCRMALHYVQDYGQIANRAAWGLRPGGSFVFSVEHPICTALCIGWHKNERGEEDFWPVDGYGKEGLRKQHWFVDGVIKYHRTVATYVNTLVDAGLTIMRLLEPQVQQEFRDQCPDLVSSLRRPPIMVVRADRPPNNSPEATPDQRPPSTPSPSSSAPQP